METQTQETQAKDAVMARVEENNRLIARAHADNLRLLASVPGLLSSAHLTPAEKLVLAERDFCFDKLTAEDIGPALLRLRFKGDGMPAYVSLAEGQIISALRFVGGAGFGEVKATLHEKKRVSICVSLSGR